MSKSFSLTHPEPPAIRRPNNADSDHYDGLALTHWLEAQIKSHDLDAAWDELTEVSNRLLRGDLWLQERGPSNPKWQRAQRTHARLHERQKELLGHVKWLYVTLWLECAAVAGCLAFVDDPDDWIDRNAPGQFEPTAKSIWYAVQPRRQPPFQSYPVPDSAYYIEYGFQTQADLEAWMNRPKEESE